MICRFCPCASDLLLSTVSRCAFPIVAQLLDVACGASVGRYVRPVYSTDVTVRASQDPGYAACVSRPVAQR